MAMKLNSMEKTNDSIIRAYNKQIENAYRKLGYNHTITRNLVNTARKVFGGDNMKEMTISKGYSSNQIDRTTGEIHAIPQIKRTRETLGTAKAKELEKEVKQTNANKGGKMYKAHFDVSKTYQNAINKAIATKKTAVINDPANKGKSVSEMWDYANNVTTDEIQRQIDYDLVAGEIFEKYSQAKEHDDDGLDAYRFFADKYNANDTDIDPVLMDNLRNRDMTLERMNNIQLDPTAPTLDEFDLSSFETILDL